jgi:hypothetical protein
MTVIPSIPREEVLAARQADIAAYLLARGEPLKPSGSRYKHAEHDSLVFTGNSYYWNARKEHGNAIDFLQRFYKMSFREAIAELTSGNYSTLPPAEPRSFDFNKIELAPDMERVILYLNKTRGISVELITELIRRCRLFQEAKTNNAIFPIYDGGGIVGAEVVGTMPEKRFKGIKNGSKYGCGYNLSFGDKTTYALFFESSIDLLSFVDLARMRGRGLESCRLTSLAGLKQPVFDHAMHSLGEQARPVLCVDNDQAGAHFMQAVQAANAGVMVCQPDPAYKDWNDWLLAFRAGA